MACNSTAATESRPVINSIEPVNGLAGHEQEISIYGSGFIVKIVRHLSRSNAADEGDLEIDDEFVVSMFVEGGGIENRYPLENVKYIDTGTIKATVPESLPSGSYSLEMIDPFGQVVTYRRSYNNQSKLPHVDTLDMPTDLETDTSQDTETVIVDKAVPCQSSQDCENPTPICSMDSVCRACDRDEECQARDPWSPICDEGSCHEPYHCLGSLWATPRITPWNRVDVHLVDCDLACTESLSLTATDSGGENEFILMRESPSCSGHFQGYLYTGNGLMCPNSDYNGCLNITAGSAITVYYQDSAGDSGSPQTAMAETQVVAGSLDADLSLSSVQGSDSNGGDVEPGDSLRFCTNVIANMLGATALDTTITHRVPRGLSYVPDSISGCAARSDGDPDELWWDCKTVGALISKVACHSVTVDPLPPGMDDLPIIVISEVSGSNALSQFPGVSFLVVDPL